MGLLSDSLSACDPLLVAMRGRVTADPIPYGLVCPICFRNHKSNQEVKRLLETKHLRVVSSHLVNWEKNSSDLVF